MDSDSERIARRQPYREPREILPGWWLTWSGYHNDFELLHKRSGGETYQYTVIGHELRGKCISIIPIGFDTPPNVPRSVKAYIRKVLGW